MFVLMCISPRIIQVKGVYSHLYPTRYINVPCGKCVECKKKYQNDWIVRLMTESNYHNQGVFFTLTYAEDHVPYTVDRTTGEMFRTVNKLHVQNWFKRFRERYKKKYGCRFSGKYFITSEYGPRTLRPHMHGLILGINKQDFIQLALSDWSSSYGYSTSSELFTHCTSRFNAIRYVAKYCSKGEFENPLVEQKKVLPNFKLISKGIGLRYVLDNKDYYLANDYLARDYFSNVDDYLDFVIKLKHVDILGKDNSCLSYSMPRYFVEKIYENPYLRAQISSRLCQVHDDLYRQELEQLQTAWDLSSVEANHLYNMQNICLQTERYRQVRKQYTEFLERSKL